MSGNEMRAVRISRHGGPEVMEVVEVPVPEPGEGQVRVQVEACGLNYSDIMIREGLYIDATRLPYLLGREFCGTIEKLGASVDGWPVGQRVAGVVEGGAMAEYVVAPAPGLMPCPDGLSAEQGAAILVQGVTAIHCLEDCGRVEPGETVLVHAAAGGVGTLAVQIALTMGAKVIGTASSAEKCKVIAGLGATAINYRQGDWVEEVMKITKSQGADVILESVGGEVFTRSFKEALAKFGRMVVYGVASAQLVEVQNREILESNKTIVGYYLGRYFPDHLDRIAAATQKLVGLVLEGKVKLVIGKVFSLDRAVEAFSHMQNRQSVGKVIVKP